MAVVRQGRRHGRYGHVAARKRWGSGGGEGGRCSLAWKGSEVSVRLEVRNGKNMCGMV